MSVKQDFLYKVMRWDFVIKGILGALLLIGLLLFAGCAQWQIAKGATKEGIEGVGQEMRDLSRGAASVAHNYTCRDIRAEPLIEMYGSDKARWEAWKTLCLPKSENLSLDSE